jgi:hypothetical protein
MMPYLAVYHLPDVAWLHEDGCGLWEVSLVVRLGDGDGDGDGERSVFEVAGFETGFWEVVGKREVGRGSGGEGWYQNSLNRWGVLVMDGVDT